MDSSDKFMDPENLEAKLSKLQTLPTMKKIFDYIEETFPGWIVCNFKSFCSNYPHLTKNWNFLCNSLNVSTAEIVIVRKLMLDKKHILLQTFAECLTKAGFAVRQQNDYLPCAKCSKVALPARYLYNCMSSEGLDIPEKYTQICGNCIQSTS